MLAKDFNVTITKFPCLSQMNKISNYKANTLVIGAKAF